MVYFENISTVETVDTLTVSMFNLATVGYVTVTSNKIQYYIQGDSEFPVVFNTRDTPNRYLSINFLIKV